MQVNTVYPQSNPASKVAFHWFFKKVKVKKQVNT